MKLDPDKFDKAFKAQPADMIAITFAFGILTMQKLVGEGKLEEALSLLKDGADVADELLREVATNAARERALREGTKGDSPSGAKESHSGDTAGTR